eukprot:Rhum_TRINITY_DN11293_c0_g1::Rhum_TRINITY_DN11293_c0_g1_i1::g.43741::m.43741
MEASAATAAAVSIGRKIPTSGAAGAGGECEVCGDATWKYKAPCCKVKYCGVACYKEHFDLKSCTGERREDERERKKRVRSLAEDALREREVVGEHTVSSGQLEAITRDAGIRAALRDPALQELVRNIDGSPDRLWSLDMAVEGIPEFSAFYESLTALLFAHQPPPSKVRVLSAPAQAAVAAAEAVAAVADDAAAAADAVAEKAGGDVAGAEDEDEEELCL